MEEEGGSSISSRWVEGSDTDLLCCLISECGREELGLHTGRSSRWE